MNSCPPQTVLEQFLAAGLSADDSRHLCDHVGECEVCRAILQRLSDDTELRTWSPQPGRIETAAPPEPELVKVLERMRETPPLESSTPLSSPDGSSTALDFLSPPERDGDLGTLGSYRILAELGRGGMGIVLKAFDPGLDRTVAIKVLRPDRTDVRSRERFVREAQAAARISHDHVVPVYSVTSPPDGPPYFVMQYIDGPTLKDRIHREKRIDPREAAQICMEVAEGLAAAHAAGLVHRDVKPANIILDPRSSRAKLMDFGLVRPTEVAAGLTDEGTVPGTPEYMSPEQIQEPNSIDPRTDVYALGVTLYEAITGEVPFRGMPHMVLQQILNDEPRAPRRLNDAIPRDVETICIKAIAKNPSTRYQFAKELADDLHRWLYGEPIRARPVTMIELLRSWCRRNPAIASLTAAFMLAVVLGFSGVIWQWQRARTENQHSRHRLVRNYVSNGVRLLNEGDLMGSLLWFVEALRLDHGDATNERIHRVRIAAVLRQCPKLLQIYFHTGPVYHAEFDPSGNRLVTASADGHGQIWNTNSGEPLTAPLHHGTWVWHAGFSPNGELVVTASEDGTASLWHADTGDFAVSIPHSSPVKHAAFSPDSSVIATASSDNTACIWDVATGQAKCPPLTHEGPVEFVAFSHDGRRLATASQDTTARVWDATSGQPLTHSLSHKYPVWQAAFDPTTKRLITASGHQYALEGEGEAKIWDVERSELAAPVLRHDDSVRCASFSPDGEQVLTLSFDGNLRIWNAKNGDLMRPELRVGGALRCATFSPDGLNVASATGRGLSSQVKEGEVTVWEKRTGRRLIPPLKHAGWVNHMTYHPDGGRIVTASDDGTARLWDCSPGRAYRILQHQDTVNHASLSPDGRFVVTASDDRTAQVWAIDDGRPTAAPLQHADKVDFAVFSTDGRIVITNCADKPARLWDARTGLAFTKPTPHDDDIPLSTALGDNATALFNHKIAGQIAQDRKGNRVATVSDDGTTARVWDVTTAHPISPPIKHAGIITRVALSRDGRRIVTASADETARVWDANTGHPLTAPLRHVAPVTFCSFVAADALVATASTTAAHSKSANLNWNWQIWDGRTGDPVSPSLWPGCPSDVASISTDGHHAVTVNGDSMARVWDLRPETRPVQDLLLLAQVLSARKIDDTGASVPLDSDTLRHNWETLKSEYPDPSGVTSDP